MVLKCEDEMWVLKQTTLGKYTFSGGKLQTLIDATIKKALPNLKIDAITATIAPVRINGASIGVVLDKLRTEYGIYSFFDDDTLKIGLPFYAPKKTATFVIEETFIDSDLEYLRKEDVKISVKGILLNTNSKEEKTYGDATGDVRTVFQYGGTIADLDRTCKQFLSEINYSGYYGSFNTFLEPTVTHGDRAIINSYKYPERNGTYLIKKVTTTVGVNGGRQNIELERRLS
jgi:hypothetical protein